jgi:DNA-binding transcriptional MocR family regulator
MRRAFDERRKLIVNELNAIPGFRCTMPKGAFYAFPNVSGTGIPSRELETKLLQRAGVVVPVGHELRRARRGLPALQLREQRGEHPRGDAARARVPAARVTSALP